ncbi:MAG: hypothetical protein MJ211_10305 [Bacteroidales bacterium]|nr:hypothetical protein [Bacteroidales bacterium]
MKVYFLLLFMSIFSITNAQNDIVVKGGSMIDDPISKIYRNGQIKLNIPSIADSSKIFIFSYNFNDKTDFSNGKTKAILSISKDTKYILAMSLYDNDICYTFGSAKYNGFYYNNLKLEQLRNIKLKLYPFKNIKITTNKYIPLAIVLDKKNIVSEEILNRFLETNDISKLNNQDIKNIKDNSTYFEILTLCIKTWKK